MQSSYFEKISSCCIGGLLGFIGGILLQHIPELHLEAHMSTVILSLSTVIGVLAALCMTYYARTGDIGRETAIRNETVALITHEMRTALTSTGWAIQGILNNYAASLTAEDTKILKDLIESSQVTVMHTVNLLDVSLLDIGKLAISLEWKTLGEVQQMIEEIISKYKMGASKDGIELTSDIHLDALHKVEVDILRIRIVLENLLENAFQYTRTSTTKNVRAVVTNTDSSLNISVADSGIGIPEDEQSKVFDEFFRASNARKVLSSGSGIGLYMCQQYVSAHHGMIRFESKEGVGTTFYITIPLKTKEDVNEFLQKM